MKDIKSLILKIVSVIYSLFSFMWIIIFLKLLLGAYYFSLLIPICVVGLLGLLFTAVLSIILSYFKKQARGLKTAIIIGLAVTILVFVVIPPHDFAVPVLMLFGPIVKTGVWSGFLMYLLSSELFIVIAIILVILFTAEKIKNIIKRALYNDRNRSFSK